MTLPQQLKALRLSAGLTQEQLSKLLGNGSYSKQTVSAIEHGSREAGLKLINDWAKACGYEYEGVFKKIEDKY
jgi:transcriptional regulator with XRE-family HTH domain